MKNRLAASLLFIILLATRASHAIPPAADIQAAVSEAHEKFKHDQSGKNASYIPYLAKVPSNLFGVAVVTVKGDVYTAGDAGYAFAIESVSKPFTMAHVMQEQGPQAVLDKIGVEPTGLPFNSVLAIELLKARSVNPLVNAGAMACVSMLRASGPQERWKKIVDNFGRFAGQLLPLNEEVYRSEAATNQRNQAIAELLFSYGRLYCDPAEACDVYTRQCSLAVTARQLAVMGATLANRGVNPLSGVRALDAALVPRVLAVMQTAGFYDQSGAWTYATGLPGKTGVGGGIVCVVPGQMSVVSFSPPLNEAGNSVRGMAAIQYIVDRLKLNPMAEEPPG